MKLKEGMYVRTKDGAIAKAEQIIDDEIHFDIKPIFSDGECLGYRWFYVKDVIKTSNNIIDLIEEGDYVNREYVYGTGYNTYDNFGVKIEKDLRHSQVIKENEIKSIVTKEQFESISYKVNK